MRLAAAASLATLLFARPAPAQDGAATIHLGVGEQKIVPVPGVTRVAIGEPDVADVKQVGSAGELLLSGLAEGRTSLLAWRNNGTRVGYAVIVRRQDPRELVSEVRALLGEREGVEVRVVGDRVYLDGQTFTAEDWDRVHQVTQLFPMVTSFVRQSPEAKRLASEALNRAYRKTGLASVQAGVVGDTLVLEGSVESEEERKKLDALTRALGEKAESLVTVGVKTLVLVEVEFVEVSSGANKLVGVKPPATLVSTGSGATAAVSVVQPIPGLDAGQTQRSGSLGVSASAATDFSVGARFDAGYARVLGRPRLVCRSGEKAEFVAGGEIPLLTATQNQFGVEWKKFGIVLRVTPTAGRDGTIAADIYAEVSDIDRSISVRANGFDVPGFRLRDVKTNVTVRDGETVALSGIYSYSEDKEVSKLPLLGHIPILGELFKSRNFVDRKTELAIFVTPRILAPGDGRARELIDGARKLYRDASGSVSFSVLD